jgi:hypothetical protein
LLLLLMMVVNELLLSGRLLLLRSPSSTTRGNKTDVWIISKVFGFQAEKGDFLLEGLPVPGTGTTTM